jgi:tetratricopeptide (TPR) repeat protein
MGEESNSKSSRWTSRVLHAALILGLLAVIGFRVYGYFLTSESEEGRMRRVASPDDFRTVRERAAEAFSRRDWEAAVDSLEAVVQREPGSMAHWARLGYAQHMLARYDPAIAAYLRVCQFEGRPRQWALRNIAAVYALKQEPQMALDYLREAVESGYRQRDGDPPLAKDPDFATLVDLPDFQHLAELTKPLSQRQVYRRLDFLIGKWSIKTPDDRRIGFVEFDVSSGGYAIVGNWMDNGRSAKSTIVAYYDPAETQWRQVWLDDQGRVIQLSGDIDTHVESGNEQVLLEGQLISADGQSVPARATLEEGERGAVRMIVSSSPDEGQRWHTLHDVTLVPQNPKRTSTRPTDMPPQ